MLNIEISLPHSYKDLVLLCSCAGLMVPFQFSSLTVHIPEK